MDDDFDTCLARIGLTESQRRGVSPAIRDAFNHIKRRTDRAAVFGAAASDAVICQRCFSTARYIDAEGDEQPLTSHQHRPAAASSQADDDYGPPENLTGEKY